MYLPSRCAGPAGPARRGSRSHRLGISSITLPREHVAGSFKDFTAFCCSPKYQKCVPWHALVSPVRVLPLGTVSFLGGAHIFESSTWIMSLEEEIIKTQNILQPLVDRPQLKAKVCIGNWKRHERLIVCSSCLNRRSASFMT